MNELSQYKILFKKFIKSDVSKGIVLIVSATVAMVLANNKETTEAYYLFLSHPIKIAFGSYVFINKNVLLWINDALMVLFFLMVGLEVKKELIDGELVGFNRLMFPVIAAIGGMFVPACIFLLFNFSNVVTRNGWAIPVATDIAFALGVLALLGNRVPAGLRAFLMALAIIDDLGAVIIIAIFYSNEISFMALSVVGITVILLSLLNFYNIYNITIYMMLGLVLWMAMLTSGVHTTLAGVIIGFFVPLEKKNGYSPAKELLHNLIPWVSWLILPLFAFANAGISMRSINFHNILSSEPLGIIFGLFVGKPLGITFFCWMAVKLKIATFPSNTNIYDIIPVGILCGIGFTMSIFISSLAFDIAHQQLVILSKLGILSGSLLSGIIGYIILNKKLY